MNANEQSKPGSAVIGRMFVHPLFDYMLIGGGLSLIVIVIVYAMTSRSVGPVGFYGVLPFVFLFSNSAHFASSTVRLYTKPGAYQSLPFLTLAFPLVALAVLTIFVFGAEHLGYHFQALYLTWSPYHYAAQAYGLAVMYSYRSGCLLQSADKKLLWWACMLPFFYTLVTFGSVGLSWVVPDRLLVGVPAIAAVRHVLGYALMVVALVMPIALFVKVRLGPGGPMPLIAPLLVLTNGIWWFVLPGIDAFLWATVFHGVQYLAIVIIFHLRDQMARPDNRHGAVYHVVYFYTACLLLGYGLFSCLPLAFVMAGRGYVESIIMVVAAINIHHFIVDGYIWRLKKSDSNRQIVDTEAPISAPA